MEGSVTEKLTFDGSKEHHMKNTEFHDVCAFIITKTI